jgi:hypothetical protein
MRMPHVLGITSSCHYDLYIPVIGRFQSITQLLNYPKLKNYDCSFSGAMHCPDRVEWCELLWAVQCILIL